MTQTFHAHVAISSRDCDGGHGHEYVAQMTTAEHADDTFGTLAFQQRIMGGAITFHTEYGQKVTVTEHGFDTSEQTDEGYRATEVRWCEDEGCDPDAGSVYDQYAQAMGY